MRIIAGEFRSRGLAAPRGMDTRPTSDRLRETLFNVLQPRIEAARFLDLYAGSGANGLEAVSRGARQAVCVEQAAPALAAIRSNVAALGVAGRVRVEGVAVGRWLGNAARAAAASPGSGHLEGGFDLVFLDPPYAELGEYSATLELLGGPAIGLLAGDALVIVEHERVRTKKNVAGAGAGADVGAGAAAPLELAAQYGRLRQTRVLTQGGASLSFYALNPVETT